jgi:hypothetical protein
MYNAGSLTGFLNKNVLALATWSNAGLPDGYFQTENLNLGKFLRA